MLIKQIMPAKIAPHIYNKKKCFIHLFANLSIFFPPAKEKENSMSKNIVHAENIGLINSTST